MSDTFVRGVDTDILYDGSEAWTSSDSYWCCTDGPYLLTPRTSARTVLTSPSFSNVRAITVGMKRHTGSLALHNMPFIVARYSDSNNFVGVDIASSSRLTIFNVVAGAHTDVASSSALGSAVYNSWHDITIIDGGTTMTCYVDDVPCLTYSNATLANSTTSIGVGASASAGMFRGLFCYAYSDASQGDEWIPFVAISHKRTHKSGAQKMNIVANKSARVQAAPWGETSIDISGYVLSSSNIRSPIGTTSRNGVETFINRVAANGWQVYVRCSGMSGSGAPTSVNIPMPSNQRAKAANFSITIAENRTIDWDDEIVSWE